MRNWYYFVWLSGDHIVEQSVHDIDICNWIKGDYPVEANGMGSCHCRDNRGLGQIYDNHFVEYTYKDGSKLYAQCRQQPETWGCVSQFVHGTKGTLQLPSWAWMATSQEHVDLIDAIRNGKSSTTAGTAREQLHRHSGPHGDLFGPGRALGRGRRGWSARNAQAVRLRRRPPALPDKDGNYPMPVPGVYQPYKTAS